MPSRSTRTPWRTPVLVCSPLSGRPRKMLTPKSPDTLFESLQLTFENERLEGLQMEDSTGQRTAIAFDDIEVNGDIDASRFTFEIPEGADVIREGG